MKTNEEIHAKRIEYVETKLGGSVICKTCGTNLKCFAEKCEAGLTEKCEGFQAIEAATQEFYRSLEKSLMNWTESAIDDL